MHEHALSDDGFMVAWRIEPAPAVALGPWPDTSGWSDRYRGTSGCCFAYFKALSRDEQAQALLNLAAGLMFEGIPPADVLREFSKVRLWRDMGVLLPQGPQERAFISGRIAWSPHNP